MTLSTARIGIAIRDFLEQREIDSDPASRSDPYGEEKAFIEFIDVSDPHNPVMHTDQGVFKIIILKIDQSPHRIIEPEPKKLPKQLPKSLLWKSNPNVDPDDAD